MTPSSAVRFSAIIPAFNAGDGFRHLLNGLRTQQDVCPPEIIVVDSGSTDGTVATAIDCGARVVAMPRTGFSHSEARNFGANEASGDYLLFTVQDALPPSGTWLSEMFEALQRYEATAVSCAEYPRVDADLFYRAASWNHTRFMGVGDSDRIMRLPLVETAAALRQNAQLSNTACLVSRGIFAHYGFRGPYAEDLDLGLRLIRNGHRLAFLGTTRIIHSHNRPPSYYLKRGYVDTLTLRLMFGADEEAARCPIPDLLTGIAASRNALDGLTRDTLATLRLPCTVVELSRRIEADLAAANRRNADADHAESDRYVDRPLASLLGEVFDRYGASGAGDGGIMLAGVRQMSGMLLSYMGDSYEAVDHVAIDEFTCAIYKGWALSAGGHLATQVLAHGGPGAERHAWLHGVLSGEV